MPTQPSGEIAAFHPEIGDLGQATLPEVGEHGAHRPVIVEADRREAGALAGHQHQFLPERRHGGIVQIVEGKQDDAVHPAPLQHRQVLAHLGGENLLSISTAS